ncbi:hypothetical protein BH23ACT10_BH23ACT10_28700 [soil metagenome]
MAQEQGRPRARRKFSEEFKRDAVELVRTTGKPIAQVADDLGIYDFIARQLGQAGPHRPR